MNSERWQQVRELLDRAIAAPDGQRTALLDAACSDDAELRNEVESLLRSHQQAGSVFLGKPALGLNLPGFASTEGSNRVGRRVGVYRLIELIGQGGMGDVYRAERADGQYDKQVAIKFVRAGLDTAAILERFRNERQVLASLDHPNIARLLDGGTTEEGIPYLVMELIEGTPIDQYCDVQKLNITERLRLLLQVASAVQYAHQHLVIHRDIKPGNILVTKESVPKLLDFGIARILDPAMGSQATAVNPMTPEYASPEQVRGEPVTTATDVYSLGVVLYQLLTGRSPYPKNTNAPHEFARAICEAEPPRPSSVILRRKSGEGTRPVDAAEILSRVREASTAKLRRRLAGDLDTIVLRAMHKEPQRRYLSVEQFAEDIRRHLNGLPVSARRDSWRYRAGKFTIRHKVGVAASALILLAVAGGVAATIREARIAAASEKRAEERFNDVRKLANSLMFEIHDAIRELPGSTSARRLIASRALEYLDNLSKQSKGDVSLQKEMAAAYERVGDVLGYPLAANLGDAPGALQSYHKALAIRESLAAGSPDVALQRDLAGTYIRISQVAESVGNFSEAIANLQKAQRIAAHLATTGKSSADSDLYGGTYYFTGEIHVRIGDFASASEDYQHAAAIVKSALELDPKNEHLRTHLGGDYAGTAYCLAKQHNYSRATEIQAQVVALLQDECKANPQVTSLQEYLGEAIIRLADYQQEQGNTAAALETYQSSHKIFGDILAADPRNLLAKTNVGFSKLGAAQCLVKLAKPAAALSAYRESIATFEEMSPRTSSNRYPRTGLANAYSGLADAYSALASAKDLPRNQSRAYWQEAHSACEKSLSLWNDKEKRGELESGELDSAKQASQCVANTEAHLGVPAPTRASLH
jgi:non-specific serine/threonine protein kinase/serine/threonine-protein kinase